MTVINFLLDHELFSDADIFDFIMTKDNNEHDSIYLADHPYVVKVLREKLQDIIARDAVVGTTGVLPVLRQNKNANK